jgi:uncharacterized protein (TIGR00725 family)
MQPKIVSVIGGRQCNNEVEQLAHNFGKKASKVVNYLCCGGLGGVMEAVCRGFQTGNGITIGILPSYNKKDANKYIDLAIPTGMGLARNLLVVKTGDVVVALPGAAGTLSEIAYCLQFGIPVISLNSWDIDGVIKVTTVDDAVRKVKELLR